MTVFFSRILFIFDFVALSQERKRRRRVVPYTQRVRVGLYPLDAAILLRARFAAAAASAAAAAVVVVVIRRRSEVSMTRHTRTARHAPNRRGTRVRVFSPTSFSLFYSAPIRSSTNRRSRYKRRAGMKREIAHRVAPRKPRPDLHPVRRDIGPVTCSSSVLVFIKDSLLIEPTFSPRQART